MDLRRPERFSLAVDLLKIGGREGPAGLMNCTLICPFYDLGGQKQRIRSEIKEIYTDMQNSLLFLNFVSGKY